MTSFLDTSVLLDLIDEKSDHHTWCVEELAKAKRNGPVIVSDVVYSEFSVTLSSEDEADSALEKLALVRCGYRNQVLFRAGKAYAQYRRNKGQKLNVLPDFFIGALAEVEKAPLLTRDPKKVGTYFPSVEIITPAAKAP